MTEELKPCPFCGHKISGNQPYWDDMDTYDVYWIIRCGYCGALIFDEDKNTVIRSWNTRATDRSE